MTIECATPEEHDPRYGQPLTACAASRDGECHHPACPQRQNYQPSCPLWANDDEAYS